MPLTAAYTEEEEKEEEVVVVVVVVVVVADAAAVAAADAERAARGCGAPPGYGARRAPDAPRMRAWGRGRLPSARLRRSR